MIYGDSQRALDYIKRWDKNSGHYGIRINKYKTEIQLIIHRGLINKLLFYRDMKKLVNRINKFGYVTVSYGVGDIGTFVSVTRRS